LDKDNIFAKNHFVGSQHCYPSQKKVYTHQDIQEFDKQIKELLHKVLIKNSKSPHTSPAFIVRNHVEEKSGKARMVINYKKFNANTVFDSYYIPNKIVLFNRIQVASWFSKMDCKSSYWQINIDEESNPLTAFSVPQGH